MIFLIFLGADLMNAALALTQVPAQLAGVVQGWGLPPVAVVGAILLFYVVLGAVMDELSMILLTIPIFFPMIMGLDFGMPKESVAIWFGIMVLMTVGFGMLAPPVGLNVYVVNGMAKDIPIAESYRGVTPFLISDTLRTLLLLFFPPISLWLVKYIGEWRPATMSEANPYAPPGAEVGDLVQRASGVDLERLRRVASGQKLIIYALLASILLIGFAATPVVTALPLLQLVTSIVAIVGVVRLAGGLGKSVVMRVLYALAMLIPLINLLIMLLLSSQATRKLRAGGVKVGFMGAKRF
jgi:hypothetical protein